MSRLSEPRATLIVLGDRATLYIPSRCHLYDGDFEPELDAPARSIRRAIDLAGERPEPVEAGERPVEQPTVGSIIGLAAGGARSVKIHWTGYSCHHRRTKPLASVEDGSVFHDLLLAGEVDLCSSCRAAFLSS